MFFKFEKNLKQLETLYKYESKPFRFYFIQNRRRKNIG